MTFTEVIQLLTDLGVLGVITLGAVAYLGGRLYKRFRG